MKYLWPPLIVGAAVVVNTVLSSASVQKPARDVARKRPLSVYVQDVLQKDVTLTVSVDGEVKPERQVIVSAEVDGRVVATHPNFVVGGIVPAGEALIEIDPSDYLHAITEAKANIAAAKSQVVQSKAQADVARTQLRGSNQSALALRLPQVEEAQARLEAAEAQLARARTNYERTKATLPYDVLIRSKDVDVGQYVTRGTRITESFGIAAAELQLGLTDEQLAALGRPLGFRATTDEAPLVTISASIAGDTFSWEGRLVRLDSAIDPATRVVYGYVKIVGPYGRGMQEASGMPLPIGLYVDAEMTGRTLEEALLIPHEALRTGDRVYVVNDGKLSIRAVDVAYTFGDSVVLSSGVSAGEQVVISPVRVPVDGMEAIGIAKPTAASTTR